jgi:hypothetical protein
MSGTVAARGAGGAARAALPVTAITAVPTRLAATGCSGATMRMRGSRMRVTARSTSKITATTNAAHTAQIRHAPAEIRNGVRSGSSSQVVHSADVGRWSGSGPPTYQTRPAGTPARNSSNHTRDHTPRVDRLMTTPSSPTQRP